MFLFLCFRVLPDEICDALIVVVPIVRSLVVSKIVSIEGAVTIILVVLLVCSTLITFKLYINIKKEKEKKREKKNV